ncbi:hypothetical protein GW17_00002530 [Ensete ventricosum]|nr:hypothetical protein GW17_00002530 [Ensete ventricosum]
MKVKKSTGHAASRPTPPPPIEVHVEAAGEHLVHGGEKRPRGGNEPPKKKMNVTVSKPPRGPPPKGHQREPTATRGLSQRRLQNPSTVPPPVLNPSLAKWLYESSSKELMDQDAKSVIWVCVFQDIPPRFPISSYVPNLSSYPLQGLHFAGTLIDRVHDYRKDLKLVADSSRVELRDLRDSRHRLEDEVLSLTKGAEMLQSELKAEGDKAIVDYKKSRGFQSELEKMGQVIYEFGYWVALKHFQMKYPNSLVEEDPFTERPKDANVRMEVS